MRINGKVIEGPQPAVCVIPRNDGDIVIRARAVLDFTDFDKLDPMPQAPERLFPGGIKQQNIEDPGYQKALSTWAQQKTDWMILQSLSATENLTWDTVTPGVPATWGNYKIELAATFTPGELSKILEVVMDACGLNQSKIEEATKRFLATQAAKL